MKGMVILLALLFGGVGLAGQQLEINGDFVKIGSDKLPAGWALYPSRGFQSSATVALDADDTEGENVLSISDVRAKQAVLRTTKRHPAQAGDVITVSARCRGQGTARLGIYTYSLNGEWCAAPAVKQIVLGNQWENHRFKLTVPDGRQHWTCSMDIIFGLDQGAEGSFSQIEAFREKARYKGDIKFPVRWTVFLPVDKDYMPAASALASIPDTFNGAKPLVVTLVGNTIDFAPFFKETKAGNAAWVFAELESAFDREVTLGAGADWWMQYFVNGSKIIDTMDSGNIKHPYRIDNHTATANLRQGSNVLAVRFVSGKASSVLKLGGPNELRAMNDRLDVEEMTKLDNYEDEMVRPGQPELIKGPPAPGITSLSGQGVYRANPDLAIYFPGETFTLPPDVSGRYFATGLRLQSFERTMRVDSSCRLDIQNSTGKERLSFNIEHRKDSGTLSTVAMETSGDNTIVLWRMEIPYAALPVDIVLAANQGNFVANINSLADSSFRGIGGESQLLKDIGSGAVETKVVFKSDEKIPAEMVVGQYFVGCARLLAKSGEIPINLDIFDAFDPIKAGWDLLLQDDFEGEKIDPDKWFVEGKNPGRAALDGKGHLIITADYDKGSNKLTSASLLSKKTFLYGYFEAKVRFTTQPGWWGAFWLFPPQADTAFSKYEIDIFEDYYIGKGRNVLDHNLHTYAGGKLKSWNYNSPLPGTVDDFYVIAARWTPFEISCYLNGRLIRSSAAHSPYESVTFDAVSHALGFRPLHLYLSGCTGRSGGNSADGKFPEKFIVDYVKVYEYPTAGAPTVAWSKVPNTLFVAPGQKILFEVDVKLSGKATSVQRVFLFDNGFLMDYKEKAPYSFEMAIDDRQYQNSSYLAPGRSGIKPVLKDGHPHVFVAVAVDNLGKVGLSKYIITIPASLKQCRPYRNKAQEIPGILKVGLYDEGGQGVAYYDATEKNHNDNGFRPGEGVDAGEDMVGYVRSGEWLNYTVDVAEAGLYDVTVSYGSDIPAEHRIQMFIDGDFLGDFKLSCTGGWGATDRAGLCMSLPEGKHIVTLLLVGAFNFGNIEFRKKAASGGW